MSDVRTKIELALSKELDRHQRDYVLSFQSFYDRTGFLSGAQERMLDRFLAEHSDEAKAKRAAWAKEFESKREEFKIILEYYKAQRSYFGSVIMGFQRDENYVPPEKTYNKMCFNKYADKVRQAHYSEPKYKNGTLVFPRSTCPSRHAFERGAIVLEAGAAPVISACKGAKRYLLLPVGAPHGILVEERHLKTRK